MMETGEAESSSSSLHHATLMGNIHLLRMLIQNGHCCSVNVQDSKGVSPLHCACSNPCPDMVSLLLQNDADVDLVDNGGRTPLHIAAKLGLLETVNLLLYYDADKTRRTQTESKTAFDLACEFSRTKVVQQLLQNDQLSDNPYPYPACTAASLSRLTSCDLMDSGGSERKREQNRLPQQFALHLAARNGHLDIINLLLNASFDINYQTVQGTALHEAAYHCQLDSARLLLYSGIDSTVRNASGQTAWDVCKKYSGKQISVARGIKKLIKESDRSFYCEAVSDYFGSGEELSFTVETLIWVLDASDSSRWKGTIFGLSSSASSSQQSSSSSTCSRTGYFPSSAVKIIDKKATMQRSSMTHRQAKKVTLPQIPPVLTAPALHNNAHSDNSQESNETVKLRQSDEFPPELAAASPKFGTLKRKGNSSPSKRKSVPSFSPTVAVFPGTPEAKIEETTADVHPARPNQQKAVSEQIPDTSKNVSSGYSNILKAIVSSPRHRASTGSNCSSQTSSGIESMKSSNSRSQLTQRGTGGVGVGGGGGGGGIRTRGESPPSRQSVHSIQSTSSSSGGGSMASGSLERLDESGYASQINIAEMIHSGIPDHEVISAWLHDLRYEEYVSLFLGAGYDLPTVARMTPEDLTAIGITKPGHRKRLTTEIHKLSVPDNWPMTTNLPGGLTEWLTILRLPEYLEIFQTEGYFNVDQVMQLTWEDFEDFGIQKLGHLKKLELAIRKVKDARLGRSTNPGRMSISSQHHQSPGRLPPSAPGTPKLGGTCPSPRLAHQQRTPSPNLTTFHQQQQQQQQNASPGSPRISTLMQNHSNGNGTFPRRAQQSGLSSTIMTQAMVHSAQHPSHSSCNSSLTNNPNPIGGRPVVSVRPQARRPESCYQQSENNQMGLEKESIYANYDSLHTNSIDRRQRIHLNLTSPSRKPVPPGAANAKPPPPRPPKRSPSVPENQTSNGLPSQNPSQQSVPLSAINGPKLSGLILNSTPTGLSPAPSLDCLPPPSVIRCEESLKNLRSLIHNPSASTAAQSDDGKDRAGEVSINSRHRPDRTSTEILPFANDNCGTIRSKHSPNSSHSSSSTSTTDETTSASISSASTASRGTLKDLFISTNLEAEIPNPSSSNIHQNPTSTSTNLELKASKKQSTGLEEFTASEQGGENNIDRIANDIETNSKGLDDIGNMLKNLTHELDSLLIVPKSSINASVNAGSTAAP